MCLGQKICKLPTVLRILASVDKDPDKETVKSKRFESLNTSRADEGWNILPSHLDLIPSNMDAISWEKEVELGYSDLRRNVV